MTKLDVFHEGLSKAVADLFQIEVAESRSHLFGVKTVATVPHLLALILVDERLPLFFFLRLGRVTRCVQFVLDLLAHGELFVEKGSLLRKRHFFLLLGRLHVCLGFRLLGRRRDNRLCLLRWPKDPFVSSLALLGFCHGLPINAF